ncbi:hypothetical protein C8R45DRAFT_1213201 [Mycena sanguinolenta]|nr:hypothetical protein C8R45DRAFT_1213201 [Mycena sanguinolenta]
MSNPGLNCGGQEASKKSRPGSTECCEVLAKHGQAASATSQRRRAAIHARPRRHRRRDDTGTTTTRKPSSSSATTPASSNKQHQGALLCRRPFSPLSGATLAFDFARDGPSQNASVRETTRSPPPLSLAKMWRAPTTTPPGEQTPRALPITPRIAHVLRGVRAQARPPLQTTPPPPGTASSGRADDELGVDGGSGRDSSASDRHPQASYSGVDLRVTLEASLALIFAFLPWVARGRVDGGIGASGDVPYPSVFVASVLDSLVRRLLDLLSFAPPVPFTTSPSPSTYACSLPSFSLLVLRSSPSCDVDFVSPTASSSSTLLARKSHGVPSLLSGTGGTKGWGSDAGCGRAGAGPGVGQG